jgi:hypothetical protein
MGALSALGVAPESPAFPAVVNCPLCQQNTLHLFDDIVTDGIWLYCNSCFAHGNIITFGAQIWNTSLPAVLTRLSDLGFISPGEGDKCAGDYERAHSKLQAANTFWEAASGQVWNHGDDILAVRLRELGMRHEIPACQGLVGVAHTDQIAEYCAAVGRSKPVALRPRGPSIVFPFYDLPGRFTGFWLVQYDDDFAMKTSFISRAYKKRRADAGYWHLISGLLPVAQLLRNRMFVVDDPFWALSAQCRQLKYGLPLLPIAASYSGAEATSYGQNWQSFYPTTRLFQGRVSTPELVSQACAAKGYVCIAPLDKKEHARKTNNYNVERLAAINSVAETWQTNLLNTLTASNELTAFAFATRLRIPADRLQIFFNKHADKFSPKFGEKVLDTVKLAPAAPTRIFRRWTLIERDNKWWTQVGQQVCNARPIITKIIQDDDGGEKMYSGQIHLGEDVYEFTDSAEKIERMGLLAYAFAHMAPLGKLITYDRHWNHKSHLLVMQLHPPALEVVSSKIGWDENTSTFRLGAYCITNSGEIAATPGLPNSRRKVGFPEPVLVAPITIRQFLTPAPQNAFVWNVFSAVAAALVAPILRKDPQGTIFTGPAFNIAAKIGAALNCEHVQTAALRKYDAGRFLDAAARERTWPVFVSSAFNDGLFAAAISKCHNEAVFVRMTEDCAAVGPGYGWQHINGDAPAQDTDFSPLQYVLPGYIQRLLKMRMSFAAQNKHLTTGILQDLHKWLQETYDSTFHLPQALNQLTTPADAHKAFMREINRAIQADKIAVIPRPRRRDQSSNYLLRRQDHWWLNRRAIDNYFAACKNIPPNWLAIIDLMVADGVYAGEETIHHLPGILVAAPWCDQFWEDYDSSSSREIG